MNQLDVIIESTKETVKKSISFRSIASLEEDFEKYNKRGFEDAIMSRVSEKETAIIAEIKKASPSKGLIREDFEPKKIAKEYEEGGATCLSVLTDEPFFQGKLEYLDSVRSSCELPILRKDFMIDTYQVFESRSWGSDCILIIMRILSDLEIDKLVNTARDLKMSILFEVHSKEEVMRALKFNPNLIGINNRNLENFKTDINNSIEIKRIIPDDVLIISESGIKSPEDISFLEKENINNFLIGESLMKSNKISEDLNLLVNKGK